MDKGEPLQGSTNTHALPEGSIPLTIDLVGEEGATAVTMGEGLVTHHNVQSDNVSEERLRAVSCCNPLPQIQERREAR